MILRYKNNNCDIKKIIAELKELNIRMERTDMTETTHGFIVQDKENITLYFYEKDDLDFLCMTLQNIDYYIPKIREIMKNNGAIAL